MDSEAFYRVLFAFAPIAVWTCVCHCLFPGLLTDLFLLSSLSFLYYKTMGAERSLQETPLLALHLVHATALMGRDLGSSVHWLIERRQKK